MLGISTCWWHDKSLRGDKIVSEALELGFQGVELEYRLSNSTYQEMKPKLNSELAVLSIHNFFPRPDHIHIKNGSGDLFLLSSDDMDERSLAVNYSIKSIEHAHDMECNTVILHLGRVDMPSPAEFFKELFNRGKTQDTEGLAFLEEQKDIRQIKHPKYIDAVLFSLEKLNKTAERLGVFLGIENRYYFQEIPNFEEIGIILKEFKGGSLRYWHDTGHARAQENLGICRQNDLLEAYSDNMLGIHLHDIKGLDDHIAPGQGEINFEDVRPFMKNDTVKIMEIHPKVEKKALIKGRNVIVHALKGLDNRRLAQPR